MILITTSKPGNPYSKLEAEVEKTTYPGNVGAYYADSMNLFR